MNLSTYNKDPQSVNQVSGIIADMIYSIVQIIDDTGVSTLVRYGEFV